MTDRNWIVPTPMRSRAGRAVLGALFGVMVVGAVGGCEKKEEGTKPPGEMVESGSGADGSGVLPSNVRAIQPPQARISNDFSLVLRSEPSMTAAEIGTVPIGTVFEATERLAEGGSPAWIHIKAAQGLDGWMLDQGSLLYRASPGLEAQLRIVQNELPSERPFESWLELIDLTERCNGTLSGDAAAPFELARLQTMARACASIPFDRMSSEPYRRWTFEHEAELVYSEPAGEWMVRADRYWDLETKYHALPIADEVAWAATTTSLPGECEGYLPCYLTLMGQMEGRYLERHPSGFHVGEALTDMEATLSQMNAPESPYEAAGDEAEAVKQLEAIKKQLTAVTHEGKAAVVKEIDALIARLSPSKASKNVKRTRPTSGSSKSRNTKAGHPRDRHRPVSPPVPPPPRGGR